FAATHLAIRQRLPAFELDHVLLVFQASRFMRCQATTFDALVDPMLLALLALLDLSGQRQRRCRQLDRDTDEGECSHGHPLLSRWSVAAPDVASSPKPHRRDP